MLPSEEIKSKIDLVDYISQQVKLIPSGKSFRGVCPFHKEKTPSFFVAPDKQIWHCFGCHKGGDIFKFVMEREHVEFIDALRILAEKAGVTLRKEDPQLKTLKNRVYDVLQESLNFYRDNLNKNKFVLDYALGRGLTPETIKKFQLGYAPAGWHNLYLHLRSLDFNDFELEQAGLILKSTNVTTAERLGYYDRFRNRLMFPIFDHNGMVAGFSGRIMPSAQNSVETTEAKYINTPDTLAYSKGRILYGFQETKEAIRESGSAVLVEGNLDFLMGYQNGIKNIAAVSGTALGEEQLTLLKRMCNSLILDFDMDAAGEMATDRSIALALSKGFEIKVLKLPDGKDLADYFQANPGGLEELRKNVQGVMDYYFARAFASNPTALPEKKKAVSYLLPRIKLLGNVLEKTAWVEKLSALVKVEQKMLLEEMQKTPALNESFASAVVQGAASESLFFRSRWEVLAENGVALVLKFPNLARHLRGTESFFPYQYRNCVKAMEGQEHELWEKLLKEQDENLFNYLYLLADFEMALLATDEEKLVEQELLLMLGQLKKEKVKNDLWDLALAVKESEQAGNSSRAEALLRQVQEKTEELAKLEQR